MQYNDCTAPPIIALFAWMHPLSTFLKLHTKYDDRLQASNQCRDIFQSQLVINVIINTHSDIMQIIIEIMTYHFPICDPILTDTSRPGIHY